MPTCAPAPLPTRNSRTAPGAAQRHERVEDSLGGIESWYYIEVLRAGANSAALIQSPEQARSALRAVTKDEVRDILRRLTLSVSYLLTKEDTAHAAE